MSPVETCFSVDINVFYGESWTISTITTDNGTQRVNLVYDSSPIDLEVGGKLYSGIHMIHSASDTSVNGALCDCGAGLSQYECQGEVCLMERGQGLAYYYEKVANCVDGGGLAAIIYNSFNENIFSFQLVPELGEDHSANIPAVFISQADGQYLVEVALVVLSASPSVENSLDSQRVCLPDGDYEFTHEYGDEHYNITSYYGTLIAQGGGLENSKTASFSLPLVTRPARARARISPSFLHHDSTGSSDPAS